MAFQELFMLKVCVRPLLPLFLTASFLVAPAKTASAQAADLISQPVNAKQLVRLNDVHPLAQAKYETGRLPASTPLKRMILTLKINSAQKSALDEFVRQTTDRTSKNYHKWITPAQFGEKYGPSTADIAQVTAWLKSQGFSVDRVGTGRTRIEFSGTAGQVENAFQTELHTYTVNGEAHIANSIPSAIPKALAPVVAGVHSLHDFFAKPLSSQVRPAYTGPNSGNTLHFLGPADIATIYDVNPLYKAGIDGTGQSIAIIASSNIDPQDIATYRSITGLPPINLNVIVDGPDPGLWITESEANLDVSLAGAVAPKATIDLIVAQNADLTDGVDLAAAYAVDNNIAPVLSESFAGCEANDPTSTDEDSWLNAVREQAAAQGITYVNGTGDSGAADCDPQGDSVSLYGYAVNAKASPPYDVAVGGTMFDDATNGSVYWSATNGPGMESALGYIPELPWDWPFMVQGTGGGASSLYSKPAWQTGPGVPDDGARDIPDLSLFAGGISDAGVEAYFVCVSDLGFNCSDTGIMLVTGTSASTQVFAGIMALVNQQTASNQGNADPAIYALANNATLYPKVFHDITSGTNDVPTVTGGEIGYAATPGYDLATGWGSIDVNQFVTNFKAVGTQATTLAITANQATVTHGQDVTFNVTLSAQSGTAIPTGDVAFFATNSAGTVSIGYQTYDGSTNTYVFDTLGYVPGGKLTVYARYGGDANFAPSTSNSVTVQVNPEPSTVTLNPAASNTPAPYNPAQPISITWGQAFAAYIQMQGANSGDGSPTGKVTVQLIASSSGKTTTVSLGLTSLGENLEATIYNYTRLNFAANTLPADTYSIVISYPGDLAYLPSVSPTYTLQIAQAATATVVGVDKSAPLINTVVNISAFVSEQNPPGPLDFTGGVGFWDNGNLIGTFELPAAPITVAGNPGYLLTVPDTITTSGTHVIVAVYQGDQNTLASQSNSFDIVVAAKSPTICQLGVTTPAYGGMGTLTLPAGAITFSVNVVGGSNGPVPTGTVTFSSGSTLMGTATLTAGVATFTTTAFQPNSTNYPISVAYGGDANYLPSAAQGLLQVETYSLAASSPSVSVQAGSASSAVTITATDPNGIYWELAFPIAYTCSGLPSGATCIFNPSTTYFDIPLSTGAFAATTSVTITTQGPTLMASAAPLRRSGSGTRTGVGAAGGLTLAALLLCVPFLGKRARKLGLLAFLAAVITVAGINGCGGSGPPKYAITDPGTPAGTYPITITATAGPTVQTTTFDLIVTSEITTPN
jgi:subtilase family serine protease